MKNVKRLALAAVMMIAGALDVTMSQLMEGVEDTSQ